MFLPPPVERSEIAGLDADGGKNASHVGRLQLAGDQAMRRWGGRDWRRGAGMLKRWRLGLMRQIGEFFIQIAEFAVFFRAVLNEFIIKIINATDFRYGAAITYPNTG